MSQKCWESCGCHFVTSAQEETSCWTFGRGTLPHSCLIEDSSCLTVQGLCHTFIFMMSENVFNWWKSGLQAGQFCTWTLLLRRHAGLWDAVLFSPENVASTFLKNNLKCWFIWVQNSFSLYFSPLNELWPFCIMFTYGFFFARWSFNLRLWKA